MVMEELHLPDNIKVHWAGAEVSNQFLAAQKCGVNYFLYTAFPFVERMVFNKAKAPLMPLDWQKDDPFHKIPKYIMDNGKHVIQDSGLFTLMFGAMKGKCDGSIINKWYDALVEFTNDCGRGATCVEVDCQKVLGVKEAWNFRERMRKDLHNNRIINVFHLEDGRDGLDKLIDFSDYIAISVPELRIAGKKNMAISIAKYIKSVKPTIDIHLLGCTELAMIEQGKFCTSCDSTTWVAPKRFGFINGKHISGINKEKILKLVGSEIYSEINKYNNEQNTKALVLQIKLLMQKYYKAVGNQNYKLK